MCGKGSHDWICQTTYSGTGSELQPQRTHIKVLTLLELLENIDKYSHLSNNRGGWNKRGGRAKVAKSINVEGGIFWKKLVHKCNKRGVEGGKKI